MKLIIGIIDYRFRSFFKVSFRNMPLGSAPDFFNWVLKDDILPAIFYKKINVGKRLRCNYNESYKHIELSLGDNYTFRILQIIKKKHF